MSTSKAKVAERRPKAAAAGVVSTIAVRGALLQDRGLRALVSDASAASRPGRLEILPLMPCPHALVALAPLDGRWAARPAGEHRKNRSNQRDHAVPRYGVNGQNSGLSSHMEV